MKIKITPSSFVYGWWLLSLCLQAQAGVMEGKLSARASSSAIPGATILAIQEGLPGKDGPRIFMATTGADGSYRIENIPAGRYRVCVHGISDRYDAVTPLARLPFGAATPTVHFLDPCEWSDPIVAVVGPETTSGQIAVDGGARVAVRVHDSNGTMRAHDLAHGYEAPISVSLVDQTGTPRPIPLVSHKTPGVIEYSCIVPPGVDLNVLVVSHGVGLVDGAGNVISESGRSFPVRAVLGSDVTIELQVPD
jgi:hypothetical protein